MGVRLLLVLVVAGLAWLLLCLRAYRVEWQSIAPRRVAVASAASTGVDGLVDVEVTRPGGDKIRGWYRPPQVGAVIVFAHGSAGDRSQMLPAARILAEQGFGVLLYDAPGCGASEGDETLGREQVEAARAVVSWVRGQTGVRHVGGLGFSIGAHVLAVTAGDEPALEALVLEAPPDDIVELTWREYRWYQAPGAFAAMWRAGWKPGDPSPLGSAPGMGSRPTLLCAGGADTVVQASSVRRLAASLSRSEIWFVAELGHRPLAEAVAGREYAERVGGFYRQAFGLPPRPQSGSD